MHQIYLVYVNRSTSLVLRFTEDLPLSKPSSVGKEGLMIITVPIVIKKVKVTKLPSSS